MPGPDMAGAFRVNFASVPLGSVPADFSFVCTGGHNEGTWTIVSETTALEGKALEHASTEATNGYWPLAIHMPCAIANFDIEARFKIITGTMKRAGLVLRLIDRNNYYAVVASALEERIDFYRVINGSMQRLWSTEARVILNSWHVLGVSVEADHFTISLDNRSIATIWDRTFPGRGRVGLWTEEDNVTRFDHLHIAPRSDPQYDASSPEDNDQPFNPEP